MTGRSKHSPFWRSETFIQSFSKAKSHGTLTVKKYKVYKETRHYERQPAEATDSKIRRAKLQILEFSLDTGNKMAMFKCLKK